MYFGLSSAIGRLLAGTFYHHPRVNAFIVFGAAEFVIGLSTILVSLASTYTPLIIYMIIYGLGDGFFFTSLTVLLLTVSPQKTAVVIGWVMMLLSFFVTSGPPLAGKCLVIKRAQAARGPRPHHVLLDVLFYFIFYENIGSTLG